MKYNFMYIFLLVSTEIALCLGISTETKQKKEQLFLTDANTGPETSKINFHSGPVKRSIAYKRLPGWSVYYGKRSADFPVAADDAISNDKAEQLLTDISKELIREREGQDSENLRGMADSKEWSIDNEVGNIHENNDGNDKAKRTSFKRLQSWISGYGKRSEETDSLDNIDESYSTDDDITGLSDWNLEDEQVKLDTNSEEEWKSDEVEKRAPAWMAGYGKRAPAWMAGYGKRAPAWMAGYGKRAPAWMAGYGKRAPAWMAGYGKRAPAWQAGYGKRAPGWMAGYGKRAPAWMAGYGKRAPAWMAGYGKRAPAWMAGYGKRAPAWMAGYGKRAPAWMAGYGKRAPAWMAGYGKRAPAWMAGYGKRAPAWMAGYGKRSSDLQYLVDEHPQWQVTNGKHENDIDALRDNETIFKKIKDIEASDKQSAEWSTADKSKRQQAWSAIYGR